MEKNNDPIPKFNHQDSVSDSPNDYNLNGKIMLSAIILLFFVIVLMLCLHIYARWYLLQSRRRRNRHRRRTQLVFFTDNPNISNNVSVVSSRGLEASVIASLPLFFYDAKTEPENTPECAVCLSEFESGETGRVLPKCKHCFHVECIDMWFHSHDTCPLCRAGVEPEIKTGPEVVINVSEPESEPGSSSSSGSGSSRTGKEVCSSSVGFRRKPSFAGVTVEVPARNELCCDSVLSTQSSFRSPMSRMLSFKRILSMDWRGSVSPSSCGGSGGGSGSGCGCSSVVTEVKIEQGGRVETQ